MQESNSALRQDEAEIITNEEKKYSAIYISNIIALPHVSLTCDVNFDTEIYSLRKCYAENKEIVVVSGIKPKTDLSPDNVFCIGCLCNVESFNLMDGYARVKLNGLQRVKIKIDTLIPDFTVNTVVLPDINEDTVLAYQKMTELKHTLRTFLRQGHLVSLRTEDEIFGIDCTPGKFADILTHSVVQNDLEAQQEILATQDVEIRLDLLAMHLEKLIQYINVRKEVENKVNDNIAKSQKEMFLREQLHVINDELYGEANEVDEFKEKIKALGLKEDIEARVMQEVNRLAKLPYGSPEQGYIRNFIETVLELPWNKETKDNLDLKQARKVLDRDHYALKDVKDRIIENLAVMSLTGKVNGQIICLVGPPGVGKTSIAKSIAGAMGREFVQVSLGGISDESVIRGHRRTYVGAMCGRILAGMKQVGTINPVFLLDEIDKMSSDIKGDPASALLEVLDPAQNDHFKDNFLELPYDLSKVLFILTANTLRTIPKPLLDRMEIIHVPSYTPLEKITIANKYLIVKQERAAGLKHNEVPFTDEILREIIEEYTFEAGVRGLERCIARVCRKYAEFKLTEKKFKHISVDNLELFLGTDRNRESKVYQGGNVGEVVGLSVHAAGGGALLIECIKLPGKGKISLTGQMGEVFKESAEAAYSVVKSMAPELGLNELDFDKFDLHLHIPHSNGVEGPSAGCATVVAIVSAFTGRRVKEHLAMTGEVSLRGRVFGIGGLRDKLLGAARVGVKTVIIPDQNAEDFKNLPKEVYKDLDVRMVNDIREVLELALYPAQNTKPAKTSSSSKKSGAEKKDASKKSRV